MKLVQLRLALCKVLDDIKFRQQHVQRYVE